MKEPLNRNEARKLIQQLCHEGIIVLSRHAKEELVKDDLATVDVMNVLRAGRILEEAEQQANGSWTYRIHTENLVVVVAFPSESKLKIVTAWRKKK